MTKKHDRIFGARLTTTNNAHDGMETVVRTESRSTPDRTPKRAMITTRTRPVHHRQAFTLPELLVAMALSVGIMWMLAESFRMGTDLVIGAKATGELSTQLDSAGRVIVRDLQSEHFLSDDTKPNRGLRLSDQRLDLLSLNSSTNLWTGWVPPTGGYFFLNCPQPTHYKVAQDAEGFWMNTTTNHSVQFTVVLPGGPDQFMFSVTSGGMPYSSRAAEVSYFLVSSGRSTSTNTSSQPLYNLYRRYRLVAPTPDDRTSLPATDTEGVISLNAAGTQVNTLADVTNPANRLTPSPFASTSTHYGEDILASNVLSFEVLPEWTQNTTLTGSTGTAQPFQSGTTVLNSDWPNDHLQQTGLGGLNNSTPTYNNIPLTSNVFDTWYPAKAGGALKAWNDFSAAHSQAIPLAIRIKSLQITVRIYDFRTQTSRQNSWKVKM
jgi:type II secretory pathway pseudopilin PulG